MNLLRAFIAIEIPTNLHQKLEARLAALAKMPGGAVRWVKPANIHLTLKFLGETEKERLADLVMALRIGLSDQQPFSIEVSGFGAFPNLNRPRIFWCGVKSNPAMKILAETVETISTRLGYSPETRSFYPHLTIGRRNDHSSQSDFLALTERFRQLPSSSLGLTPIDSLTIFRSRISSSGSAYERLAIVKFSS